MINKRICSEIVPHYVEIKDAAQRITFVENLRLSGKKIEWVEVFDYRAGQGYFDRLCDGTVLNVDEEELNNTWLVLVNQSREIINRVSFSDILARQRQGTPLSLKGMPVDISSSYVMRTNPQNASPGTTLLLLFGIESQKTLEDLQQIKKNSFVDNIAVTFDETLSGYKNIYFPDQQSFRGRLLTNINVVKCDITPDGYTSAVSSSVETNVCPTLTLVDVSGKLVTDKLPIANIMPFSNGYVYPVFFNEFSFDGVNIDWARSFVSVDSGVGGQQLYFNVSLTKNW
jgi:hypothetical protein